MVSEVWELTTHGVEQMQGDAMSPLDLHSK